MKLYTKFHLPSVFRSRDIDPHSYIKKVTKSLKCDTVHNSFTRASEQGIH